ncbi:serine carboxypeptidase-like 45 [Punica granatum]|uniref:Carboxypeptidase n=2 Tax=Punica granatum TaxID=22663 RepID=A0A218WKI6_PUNGR|nr:serine carboxypeptidase-like 45 [Punica granatum]OWM73093.1 hypothetical protein CDL15_Pgr001207 [Punica granatum]
MKLKQWTIAATICSILLQIYPTSSEKITSLPGQPPVSFQQHSGYITIDEKQHRALFYYFAEAETSPTSKPLVLWLNGGPGCSSVGAGAFCEHGPFKPRGDILLKNEYSWNKEANMLYLESPAGVGFSYSANTTFYKLINDEITAWDNLVFLENWLKKFPQYKSRDLYIAGESYAGHYVPQLAQLVVQSKKLNLKGIAIGNPLLEFNIDFNSRAVYLWSHGLISDWTYEKFTFMCNFSTIRRQAQSGTLTPVCQSVISLVGREIGNFIDTYDITLDVCLSSAASQSIKLNQLQDTEEIDVCVEDETFKYLNRKDVQAAFHARLVGVTRWSICSEVLHYDYQNLEVPMIPVLSKLVKSGIRVLVYSGDQDSVLPLTGTRTIVNVLAKQLGLNMSGLYRAWYEGRQVGGWTQDYGRYLSFATIRGASHEAPFSQPERSLMLFASFVRGKPLPAALSSSTSDDQTP